MDLSSMILRSLDDQIGKFREDRRRLGRARAIDWKELEEGEIIRLCEELTPRFDPDLYRSLETQSGRVGQAQEGRACHPERT
ncbi:MAG: hypothetical protein IPI69_01220 [Bacteroidales bacterium]|nr:hypothetical protein [Bacteroidales bacterium]